MKISPHSKPFQKSNLINLSVGAVDMQGEKIFTHGRRISANRLGKRVAPPKENTACIKPLTLSRKLSPGGEPPEVVMGGGSLIPLGRSLGNEARTAV